MTTDLPIREATGFTDKHGAPIHVGDTVRYQFNRWAYSWADDPMRMMREEEEGKLPPIEDQFTWQTDTVIRARSGRYELEKGCPSTLLGCIRSLEQACNRVEVVPSEAR